MKQFKILNAKPFVRTVHGDIGIADANGSSASSAWCIDDSIFNEISGEKFGWFAPNGELYIEHRDIMYRPSEQEILEGLRRSVPLQNLATEKGYIQEANHE